MSDFQYTGNELDLFASAHNWKEHWFKHIKKHLRGSLLEVGAGIGSNTPLFAKCAQVSTITCLEPDSTLATRLEQTLRDEKIAKKWKVIIGATDTLKPETLYDSIVYIDVLEHIQKDKEEIQKAVDLLTPDGKLIVLSPAHNYLYTPFDQAIGHFRRYNRQSISALTPPNASLLTVNYLDSCGLLASGVNKIFLKSSKPQLSQILFWDKYLVLSSRFLDPILRYTIGKTIVAIWRKK